MGYRLPLDSLPWASPEAREQVIERDPFAPRPELRRGERVERTRPREQGGPFGIGDVFGSRRSQAFQPAPDHRPAGRARRRRALT